MQSEDWALSGAHLSKKRTVASASQDAAPAAAKGAQRAEGIDAELDAAHAVWLPDGTAMLMLRSGQMLLASLHAEGGVVRRIQARRLSISLCLLCASKGHRALLCHWVFSIHHMST